MAMVWQCDRCKRTSDNFEANVPPEGWRPMEVPVRGSQGARSDQEVTICDTCDDRLYEWLHAPHDHRCQP